MHGNISIFTEDKADRIQTITTLEIAEMMETEHSKILRKLEGDETHKGIISVMSKAHLGVAEFFQEGTYLDIQGKHRKCYNVTKLGCDFLANKFSGEKGILFTARYVKRFREMEEQVKKKALPMTYRDAVAQLLESIDREEKLQAQLDTSKEWYSIKRVAAINGVPWKTFKWRKLKEAGEQMGYEVKKIFDANYGEVNTYHKDVWEACYPEYEI